MKNEKFITVIFVFALISMNSRAQLVRFGAKGGVNLSTLNVEDIENEAIIGWQAGIWMNAPLLSAFSIQPELLFTQKGTGQLYSSDDSDYEADGRLKLNYIEIPIHLVYQVFRNVEIEAGPYAGYLINSNMEASLTTSSGSLSLLSDLDREDFENFDLGLSLGGRIMFERIYLGFSYKLGFEQVSKDDNLTDVLLGEAKNRTYQVYLAIPF